MHMLPGMHMLLGVLLLFVSMACQHTTAKAEVDIFGLKRGMTVEEIGEVGLGDVGRTSKKNLFEIVDPPRPQDALGMYLVVVPGKGLLKIRILWIVETESSVGDELRDKFHHIHAILIKKYKDGEIDDSLGGRPAKNAEDWELSCIWHDNSSYAVPGFPELESIYLKAVASASNPSAGLLMLTYEFRGWIDYLRSTEDVSGF